MGFDLQPIGLLPRQPLRGYLTPQYHVPEHVSAANINTAVGTSASPADKENANPTSNPPQIGINMPKPSIGNLTAGYKTTTTLMASPRCSTFSLLGGFPSGRNGGSDGAAPGVGGVNLLKNSESQVGRGLSLGEASSSLLQSSGSVAQGGEEADRSSVSRLAASVSESVANLEKQLRKTEQYQKHLEKRSAKTGYEIRLCRIVLTLWQSQIRWKKDEELVDRYHAVEDNRAVLRSEFRAASERLADDFVTEKAAESQLLSAIDAARARIQTAATENNRLDEEIGRLSAVVAFQENTVLRRLTHEVNVYQNTLQRELSALGLRAGAGLGGLVAAGGEADGGDAAVVVRGGAAVAVSMDVEGAEGVEQTAAGRRKSTTCSLVELDENEPGIGTEGNYSAGEQEGPLDRSMSSTSLTNPDVHMQENESGQLPNSPLLPKGRPPSAVPSVGIGGGAVARSNSVAVNYTGSGGGSRAAASCSATKGKSYSGMQPPATYDPASPALDASAIFHHHHGSRGSCNKPDAPKLQETHRAATIESLRGIKQELQTLSFQFLSDLGQLRAHRVATPTMTSRGGVSAANPLGNPIGNIVGGGFEWRRTNWMHNRAASPM